MHSISYIWSGICFFICLLCSVISFAHNLQPKIYIIQIVLLSVGITFACDTQIPNTATKPLVVHVKAIAFDLLDNQCLLICLSAVWFIDFNLETMSLGKTSINHQF